MSDEHSELPSDLLRAFGEERFARALGTARGWLLRSVLEQVATGDLQRLSELAKTDALLIEKALFLAELSALEQLDYAESQSRTPQAVILRRACSDAFYLLRALPRSADGERARKELLRLASFGVLGDRSADVRRWLREQGLPPAAPESAPWPIRVFASVADAFLRVVRKDGWQDLHQVAANIATLRNLQTTFEKDYLSGATGNGHVAALELVALYHLAKAVETLGSYCGKGSPKDVVGDLQFHFLRSIRAASASGMMEMDVLLRWLRSAAIKTAQNSVWWLLRSFNSRISEHVRHIASETFTRPMLELLPPQRRALLEDGLLDPAHRAVVVQMPTSSGKTLLAQFRILQARNSFPEAWIAYLVPTRALVNQIALRLRRDLQPLGIKVESAAPVQEFDVFEEEWLVSPDDADVVVTTPEKLDLLIRGDKRGPTKRPLGLVILDEAHNLAERERGVRTELLLAMLNREYPDAQFLLLTPFVPNGKELASWLDDQRSHAITVLAADWQPNDRAIGIVYPHGRGRDWGLRFRTLHTMPAGIEIEGDLPLEGPRPPLGMPVSKARGAKSRVAAAAARILGRRAGTSCIVLADSPSSTWDIADLIASEIADQPNQSDRVSLVRRFLESEFSPEFRLCDLLRKGIAVHHGGLSPDARFLVEWLTEEGDVQILIATTTLAQGVNFPVSSVVLATHYLYRPNAGKEEMSPAAFQNLAGRAGRLFQDTLGIVAFASQDERAEDIQSFVSRQVQDLTSALEEMVRDVLERGLALNLNALVREDAGWASFGQYLAHVYRQTNDHEKFVGDTEKLLRATWGYRRLAESQPAAAEQLVEASREYAATLQNMGAGVLSLVDSTGFSGETIMQILRHRDQLPDSFPEWEPRALFQPTPDTLAALLETLLGARELQLEMPPGSQQRQLAEILSMWVRGESIATISTQHFMTETTTLTEAITKCCQQLFQRFAQAGAWGLGALQTVAGVNLVDLSPSDVDAFRTVPAMVFYGVSTVPGVLMRTLSVPRSVAVSMGERFKRQDTPGPASRVQRARTWIESQPASVWDSAKAPEVSLSGEDYRRIWRVLNGIED
jgi:hypothetical protein